MLKIYGSDLCPDCVSCKAAFDANNVTYEFVNITESMRNLKEFLKLRDNDSVFDDPRQKGYVGIPALLFEDGRISLDWESYLTDNGFTINTSEKKGTACRIDGSGC
ncbi:MAG: hypothetical protein IJI41_09610 [Anaerolineaceae bacterium]|nr:hypothetical protein [Anaerolineaceae bacterium]